MARLATQADFEGQVPDSLYSAYQKFPFFAQRAQWLLSLHGRLVRAGVLSTTPAGTKVCVAGCAYGYLVEELVARGFDAWGFDASGYALDKMTTSVDLATRGRVLFRDMLNSSDWNAVRQAANLRGNQKFHVGITEDVLPAMSDAEVATAIGFARSGCTVLVHVVTPGVATDPSRVAPLNWKTMEQWRAALSLANGTMPDWLLNAEGDPTDPAQVGRLEHPPTGWVEPAP